MKIFYLYRATYFTRPPNFSWIRKLYCYWTKYRTNIQPIDLSVLGQIAKIWCLNSSLKEYNKKRSATQRVYWLLNIKALEQKLKPGLAMIFLLQYHIGYRHQDGYCFTTTCKLPENTKPRSLFWCTYCMHMRCQAISTMLIATVSVNLSSSIGLGVKEKDLKWLEYLSGKTAEYKKQQWFNIHLT